MANPDATEDLKPSFCKHCGSPFSESDFSFQKRRQVIDIPIPKPFVTEYRQYSAKCSCGCEQSADFPLGVNSHVQYGENHWAWVWQNKNFCYLTISPNRGSATVEEHFPEGFPNAVLSSDRWAAHLKTAAAQHQICLAHLLRKLNYLETAEKHSFAIELQALLRKAIHAKKEHVFDFGCAESQVFEKQLDRLL